MGYRIAANSAGGGGSIDLGTDDNLAVPLNVNVYYGFTTIYAAGIGQYISVYGFVGSGESAMFLSNGLISTQTSYRVMIGSQGVLESTEETIRFIGGSNNIKNYGQISSQSREALSFFTDSASHCGIVRNFGTINGNQSAIVATGGDLSIYNYGRITAEDKTILTNVGNDMVLNRGQIDGSIDLADGADRVLNRGMITGDVLMGAGIDLLDNRGGTIEGAINLGADDDTLMPGASTEIADGGTGSNTLDFSKSSGVHLALDASIDATGWASGDSFTGFANIVGSATGNDILVGDGSDNTISGGTGGGSDILSGLDGSDTLDGGRGNDTLDGGAGIDTLTGGLGNDILTGGLGADILSGGAGADKFVFGALDLAGTSQTPGTFDTIADFAHSEGDKINLAAVDANTLVAKDQAFTFIGNAAFHNIAGELRYENQVQGIFVLGDTNGDGTADFAIRLPNIASLIAGDFVL